MIKLSDALEWFLTITLISFGLILLDNGKWIGGILLIMGFIACFVVTSGK